MIDYRIDLSQAHAHRFVVTLKIARPQAETRVSLPVWIPGSYLVREFARHLNGLRAEQAGQPCAVVQQDKASWRVLANTDGRRGALTLHYEVYANDTSVRAAFLDSRRGFFNGTSVCLQVEGFENGPHALGLTGLPKGWQVATSLPAQGGKHRFEAPNYDELVDHPVELGTFWRDAFEVRGVTHELVVAGHHPKADLARLLKDTQAICEAEIGFWHGRRKPPFDRYVFMLNVVEDGYGGLEHRASTALICSRKDLPEQGDKQGIDARSEGYTTLLGLISHEYFHTWNVKRLKPREFAPYDYTRENYTRMLWFFEGFTSYYDDLLLLRAGLLSPAAYVKLLTKPVNQVLATPGRQHQSVAQASMDAWIRYYRMDENTANSTVSYYTKGSLVALCLDLSLRLCASVASPPVRGKAAASRQPSLDGVMARLWALQRPIEEADVAQALAAEADTLAPPSQPGVPGFADWQAWLQHLVHGTDELPLPALLKAFGVDWTAKPPSLTQQWGLRTTDKAGALVVGAVMRGSPAERAGLSAGDELLALNQWRVRKPDDLKQWLQPGQPQQLLVNRDQRLFTATLPEAVPEVQGWGQSVVLSLPPEDRLDGATLGRRAAWLKTC
ncbi:M61 family peptidase [Aquabacterium lacunae]|uniref:M61 family peptidase n=1 Tax=Aquabacterium lacunae TaxID=2528630 RepID=A0A4Q9H4V0_9BURK|nr:PDZ domain-containing protein [Aquabacterium lacunae]TBO32520.1 M61 family peptidase [Aquabacterium lacunae]